MAGADLKRKKVRDTVKALLLGNTDAGDKVFTSRINKAFLEELPGIFIYTPQDTPQLTRKMDQDFERLLLLNAEVIVDQKEEADIIEDIADVIAGQVEDILLPNIFLRNPPPQDWPNPVTPGDKLVNYIQLTDTLMSKADDIKEDAYGVILQFTCGYFYEKATTAFQKDFNRFGHDYKTDEKIAANLTEIP